MENLSWIKVLLSLRHNTNDENLYFSGNRPSYLSLFSIIFAAYNTRATQAIKAAMREWESKTCIRFKRRTSERNYLEFFKNNG